MKSKILLAACICCSLWAQAKNNYADYVSTLVGTDSNFELSTGNTYPATAMPGHELLDTTDRPHGRWVGL